MLEVSAVSPCFLFILGDGLAEKLRFHLKRHGFYQDPPSLSKPAVSIPCIYSTEKPVAEMLSLEESQETKVYKGGFWTMK